jgi:hypothetical protein
MAVHEEIAATMVDAKNQAVQTLMGEEITTLEVLSKKEMILTKTDAADLTE